MRPAGGDCRGTRPMQLLASCARRLGFDRNALRRGTDRIETAVRLAVMILLVVVVPAAAIAVGRQAATRGRGFGRGPCSGLGRSGELCGRWPWLSSAVIPARILSREVTELTVPGLEAESGK